VSVPNQGGTAWCLLHMAARLAPGERVLLDAAGGGVGLWAIQLAKAHGAGFIGAITSGADKQAAALDAGADAAFAPDDAAWPEKVSALAGGAFDIFLDSVGGRLFAQGFGLLGPFGRAVCYGLSSGEPITVTPSAELVMTCRSVHGLHMDTVMADPPRFRAILDRLFADIAAGKIAPRIARTFALAEARAAQAYLESRQASGKVVLVP
jgi:NADPH2:quinone reductase